MYGFFKKTVGSFSPVNLLAKAYRALPKIGLTGTGFTINSFSFSLNNIPVNLRKTLMFSVALLHVVRVKAEELYFTDESKRTHYKFCFRDDYYNAVKVKDGIKSCNTTIFSKPFSLNFTTIRQWVDPETVVRLMDENSVTIPAITKAIFSRAEKDKPLPVFEQCVTEVFDHPVDIIKIGLIIAGSLIGVSLVCYGVVRLSESCPERSGNNNAVQVNHPQPAVPQLQPANPQPPPVQPPPAAPAPPNPLLSDSDDDDDVTDNTGLLAGQSVPRSTV